MEGKRYKTEECVYGVRNDSKKEEQKRRIRTQVKREG